MDIINIDGIDKKLVLFLYKLKLKKLYKLILKYKKKRESTDMGECFE